VGAEEIVFDHSSQFINAPKESEFRAHLQPFIDANVLMPWDGPIGTIDSTTMIAEVPKPSSTADASSGSRFVGRNGMADFSIALAEGVNIRRPVWVSAMAKKEGKWELFDRKTSIGLFDYVVSRKTMKREAAAEYINRIVMKKA
jgi:predicted NAD/FAD-dependent oxidoreductase